MDTASPPNAAGLSARLLLGILAAIALLRIATLGAYPLLDTTEARYAEIGREMYASGDWITPRLGGEPFWAKPPLSIWVTAASFHAFGVSEFSARIGVLLFSVCTALFTYWIGAKLGGRTTGLLATVLLLSMGGFFVTAGAVMTDAALGMSIAMSMAGFAIAVHADDARSRMIWGHLFFAGLGLSLLAKGPVGIVLTVFPIAAWTLFFRSAGRVYARLPWLSGTALTLLIGVPWFVLAELRTPGFLRYYLVGEHFLRYVQSDWPGDLYGSAHARPRGTIWLYLLMVTLPWIFLIPAALPSAWRRGAQLNPVRRWQAFFLLWALFPAVFFTMAGNILPSYVVPGLPGWALAMAFAWNAAIEVPPRLSRLRTPRAFAAAALAVPLILSTVGVAVARHTGYVKGHERTAEVLDTGAADEVVFVGSLPHSAQFYTEGTARNIAYERIDALAEVLSAPVRTAVVVRTKYLPQMPAALRDRLVVNWETEKFTVLLERETMRGG